MKKCWEHASWAALMHSLFTNLLLETGKITAHQLLLVLMITYRFFRFFFLSLINYLRVIYHGICSCLISSHLPYEYQIWCLNWKWRDFVDFEHVDFWYLIE